MLAGVADTQAFVRNDVRREMLTRHREYVRTMATILVYTSPALGHLFPFSALLLELSSRGHDIHLRTLSTGVDLGRQLGFTTDIIDPRIEAIANDDWKASSPRGALNRAVDVFCRRAAYEVADFADAGARMRPDALLVDVN